MRWGDKIAFLQKMQNDGQIVPSLENRPQLLPYAQIFWDAFWALCNSRQIGFEGAGPIPVSEVWAYAKLKEWDTTLERFELEFYIRACDNYYLEALSKQRKKVDKTNNSTSSRR